MVNRVQIMLLAAAFTLILLGLSVDPLFAGPGGAIAKVAFKSSFGKIILVLLTLLFAPLLIYIFIKEKILYNRAFSNIRYLSKHTAIFNWIELRQRIQDCFYRVHSAWNSSNLEEVSEWMTDWYWQNQQMVFLDRWRERGLTNECVIQKISSIQPVLVSHSNSNGPHGGSKIVVNITAKMTDFLYNTKTGDIVEGDRDVKTVTRLWTFTYERNNWVVSNIEEGSMLSEYAQMVKALPPIEETIEPVTEKLSG